MKSFDYRLQRGNSYPNRGVNSSQLRNLNSGRQRKRKVKVEPRGRNKLEKRWMK